MDVSPNLGLPYILAAQAQKHVTHNEAIRALDALVQLTVLDRDLAAPPASPADGARYIIAASPIGAWSGHDGKIAAWQDGAWEIFTPSEGWIAWVADEDTLFAWDGSAWGGVGGGGGGGGGGGSLNPATGGLVGVNATADATNRLSVSSPASLFNHEGAGHQQKINKAAAGDTASQLYQTGFSGRAEVGLTGDDDFHFKVSPDGATWKDAIQIDKSTGVVTMPFTSLGGGGGGGGVQPNYFAGLTISNNVTDPTNDIDIAAGTAADTTNVAMMTLAAALTKRLDAVWAVGSNQGGLDTGAKANSTWYHLHLIQRSDTGVVDVLFSTSATAPTMPASYDRRRRIGAVLTSAAGVIGQFLQTGDVFLWKTPAVDYSTTTLSTVAVLAQCRVPDGVVVEVVLNLSIGHNTSARFLLVTPTYQDDVPPITGGQLSTGANPAGATFYVPFLKLLTNTSRQVRARSNAADTIFQLSTLGWKELL